MNEKIVVMGGGISGLSVGINALLNGYECVIVEKNQDVGGCCGGYYREGYLIDHCIHWLIGTNETSMQYEVWKKLHAFNEETKFFHLQDLVSIEYDGKIYRLGRDYEKCYEELISYAPEDKKMIDELFNYIRHMVSLYMNADYHIILNNISHVSTIVKTSKISRLDYAKRFKNKGMQYLITNAQNGYCNLMFFLFEYSCFINDNANIPTGGSIKFKENIKNYYLELGGRILSNAEVTDLELEKGQVKKLIAGEHVIEGDYFVCAFNPFILFRKILPKRYVDRSLNGAMKKIKGKIPSCTQVCMTIEGDISSWPIPYGIDSNNIKVGAHHFPIMMLRNYGYDEELYVKDGKSVVCILFDQQMSDYQYWKSLTRKEYVEEKNRIGKDVINSLETRFPKLKGKVEVIDIYTPLTLKKWTNNEYGAYMSFPISHHKKFYIHPPKLKGFNNLYITGMWTLAPGGLPFAALSGNLVLGAIKLGNKFKIKK